MKNQALFSSTDKSKKLKCRLLQFLLSTLRAKIKSCYVAVMSDSFITITITYTKMAVLSTTKK